MDLKEIMTTNFVLLQDSWTITNCLALLKHLQPSHAIISSERRLDQYYLTKAAELSQHLVDAPETVFLAEALTTTMYAPVPALESDSEAEDAPDRCIVLEDGYPVGFFDASIPPDQGTLRGTKGIHEIDQSELTPPALIVDVPPTVSIDGVVSVVILLSIELLSEIQNVLLLNLPAGAAVDIVMWARKGIIFEGATEGQLVIPEAGETLPLQFRLRGVEPGLRKFRICAFHNRQSLGVIHASIQVLSGSETSDSSHHSEVYPLQPLSVHYPGLPLLTLERHLTGKSELTPPLGVQSQQSRVSALMAKKTPDAHPHIQWEKCQPELLINNLKLDQKDSETNTQLKELLVSELSDLLGLLFSETNSILVETLTPGFSGAKVLKVMPFITEQGGGRWFVVKFGNIHTIEQEYTNYRKYVYYSIKDAYNASADKYDRTTHLGGIIYTFVGTDIRRMLDFEAIYQQKDVLHIKDVLYNLFRYTCENWYASTTELQLLDLTKTYQGEDNDSLEKLELLASESLPEVQFQQTLLFKSFKRMPARSFPNPFRVLRDTEELTRRTYVSTTHGDLNQHNILVDQMNYSWLIDFQNTGRSHILRDVATLDVVTRFQLLYAHQATLDEFLAMEEALCTIRRFSQLEDLTNHFVTDNLALLKTYQTVLYLRTLAHWMVERNPADDMSEYSIALLYITMDTLQYFSLANEQRERALLSASLLVETLGLVKK